MCGENDIRFMLRFLNRHYGVTRIKNGKHFKRAIILNSNNIVILGEKSARPILNEYLFNTLEELFRCDTDTINYVLDKFLSVI